MRNPRTAVSRRPHDPLLLQFRDLLPGANPLFGPQVADGVRRQALENGCDRDGEWLDRDFRAAQEVTVRLGTHPDHGFLRPIALLLGETVIRDARHWAVDLVRVCDPDQAEQICAELIRGWEQWVAGGVSEFEFFPTLTEFIRWVREQFRGAESLTGPGG